MSSLFPICLEEVPDYIIPHKVSDEYRHGDEVHGPRWGLAYKQRFEPEFDEIFANLRKQEKQPAVRTYKEFSRFPRAGMRTEYAVTAHVTRGGRVERDPTAPRRYEDQEAPPANDNEVVMRHRDGRRGTGLGATESSAGLITSTA